MKILLDTHVFLWWNGDAENLSARAIELIADTRNEVYVSVVSAWEITIKSAKGRLILPDEPAKYLRLRIQGQGFQVLPITFEHAVSVFALPSHHADPFDRLLIGQSMVEKMPLLTTDSFIRRYNIETLW